MPHSMRNLSSQPEIESMPLQWKHGVLTAELLGKSLYAFIVDV